jgi:hypothetical protein
VTATGTTWTVKPHAGQVDAEASALAGAYRYSFDTNQTGSVTAANATLDRRDIVCVQVSDPDEGDGSSASPKVDVVYVAGTPASTPSAPATPARSFRLALIDVPSAGTGSPSVTWVAPTVVAAGGIIPVDGAANLPANGCPGQWAYNSDAEQLYVDDGTDWLPGPFLPCSRQAYRTTNLAISDSAFAPITNFDDSAVYSVGGIALSAGAYEAPHLGLYRVTMEVVWAGLSSASPHRKILAASINGGSPGQRRNTFPVPASLGAVQVAQQFNADMYLATGTTVQIQAYSDGGAGTSIVEARYTMTRIA